MAQFLGRAAARFRALARHALRDVGNGECRDEAGIDLVDDGARGFRRRHYAVPRDVFIAQHAGFRDGRHLGQRGRALLAADPQRFQPAAFHVRYQRRHRIEHQVHLAADEIGDGGGGALVRHVHHVRPGHRFEQLHREVVGRAFADRRVIEFAWLRPGVRDEFLYGIHRHRVVHREQLRIERKQTDWREVLHRVVRQFAVEQRIDDERPRRAEQQGVAVGCRFRHGVRTNDAAGAAAVVDNDLLAPGFSQFHADGACDDVRASASGKRHNQADGFIRIAGCRISGAGLRRTHHCERNKNYARRIHVSAGIPVFCGRCLRLFPTRRSSGRRQSRAGAGPACAR